jgi:hypothetical protein
MSEKPEAMPLKYMAAVELERSGVKIEIAEVPSHQLAAVVRHALKALETAGLTEPPSGDQTLESVGNYAPLDVKDDAYDQGRKPKRVGF